MKTAISICRQAQQYGRKKVTSSAFLQVRLLSATHLPDSADFDFPEDAAPQGIQGSPADDCVTFSLWLDNCRRYGLANCDQQLQGIQTGRKTLGEVMAEQEKLIAEIAERYQANARSQDVQGVQESMTMLPDINMPCPQGVQGEDCERFKIWLENCHRFGFSNCINQLQHFHKGRKTLSQIFQEQDRAIKEAASVVFQQRRKYSSSFPSSTPKSGSTGETKGADEQEAGKSDDGETAALSSRQKLQRAVKEYGSTVMIFHISISLASLGFFYTLVNSGVDVVGILSRVGIGGESMHAKIAGSTGTFVVAYAVHKLFAPARIAMTLTATPLIVRYLRRIGFLKTPKPSPPKS